MQFTEEMKTTPRSKNWVNPNSRADPMPAKPGMCEEVLVIIRFDSSYARNYHNAIDTQAGMMERTYLGRERFFCSQTTCTSSGDMRKRGIGIIEFDRSAKAHEWLISAPQIRQNDWLHGVDILMVPARTPWHPDMKSLELANFHLMHDGLAFQEEFLNHLPYPDPNGPGPYNVVAAPDYAMQRIRGNWGPRYLVLNQWASPQEAIQRSMTQGPRINEFTDIASATVYLAEAEVYKQDY